MKALTREELLELRKDVSAFNIPEEEQDYLIRLIDAIIVSIIDQEFGWSPVQISLSARANHYFSQLDSCSSVIELDIFCHVDAHDEGVAKPEQSADHFAP